MPAAPSAEPSERPAEPPANRRRFVPVLVRATAVTAALGLAVGGLLVLERRDDRKLVPPVQPALQPVALNGFGSCDEVLRYYRAQGAARVGPYGLGSPVFAAAGREAMLDGAAAPQAAPRADADTSGSGANSSAGASGGGGTNVQVAGVDEADLMKLSGDRLVSVTDGVLRVSQLGSGTARLLGTLRLKDWHPDQLLLDGDHALLIGTSQTQQPGAAGNVVNDLAIRPSLTPQLRLAQLDLSLPAKPRVERQLDVDGSLVGARLADGRVQLAVSTGAGRLPWVYPGTGGKRASERATASNKDLVAKSELADWLPAYTARETKADGTPTGPTRTGRLVDCDTIAAPAVYSGLDTLSLLSLDLAGDGLRRWTGAAVVASGSMLYATANHTYVATSSWATQANDSTNPPDGSTMLRGGVSRTEIHRFDTTDGVLQYIASGRVDGSLLGQFAMDEYQGRLRVASTVQAVPMPRTSSSSSGSGSSSEAPATRGRVTVLQQDGDALKAVGTLDHLGEDESVQGVRFAGPLGYVVTFRQTDPLFTLDLADPRHPRKVGELKMLGYSAYLHPARDGLLLGLGQDADAEGRTSGLQLSAFDVKNPAKPTRVGQVTLPGAWSGAEWDHHAFTMDGDLVLVPFSANGGFTAGPDSKADPTGKYGTHDAGVLAVRLVGRKLAAPVTLRPVGDGPVRIDYSKPNTAEDLALRASPLRTTVVDGTVYTLTAAGIAAHDPVTGTRLGFTRW